MFYFKREVKIIVDIKWQKLIHTLFYSYFNKLSENYKK